MTKAGYNNHHHNLFNVCTLCIENIGSIHVSKALAIM